MMNQEWHQCGVCHKIFVRPEIEYKTDPYRSGMLDEDAPVGSAKLFCEKTEHSKEKQQAKHEHNIGVFSVEKAIMGRLKAEVKRIT